MDHMNEKWPDQEPQCVILAGGKGTRLEEQSTIIPKPMVEVAGKPLLHHIMDKYMKHGIHNFIVPVGYKKEIVFGYFMSLNPVTIAQWHEGMAFWFQNYSVRVIDTGDDTMTGGRLKRLEHYLMDGGPFHFTYGDGLSNVDIGGLVSVHRRTQASATITVVHPEGRFGRAVLDADGHVIKFGEKIETETDWINGGFSILNPSILAFIRDDTTNLEKEVYPLLVNMGLMAGYKHVGFWRCVDTLRDLHELRDIYQKDGAMWLR